MIVNISDATIMQCRNRDPFIYCGNDLIKELLRIHNLQRLLSIDIAIPTVKITICQIVTRILRRQWFKRDRHADLGDIAKHIAGLNKSSVRDKLQEAKAEVQSPAQKGAKKDQQSL